MATPKLDSATLVEALRVFEAAGRNVTRAAHMLGVSRGTFQHRLAEARRRESELAKELDDAAEAQKAAQAAERSAQQANLLNYRIRQLEAELALARKDQLTTAAVRHEILRLRDATADVCPPSWVTDLAAHRGHNPLTPMTIWSDWHWGEVVNPAEVNSTNSYDLTIARARAERLVHGVIDLATNYTVHGEYNGIVVMLGGDMVSGTIHDELNRTNETPIMPAVVDIYGVLIRALDAMLATFGKVLVPAVAGNHGRTTAKPHFKQAAYLNYDWLLYSLLEKHYEDNPNITFMVPAGIDAHFKVWNHRFLLTHGDKLGTAGGDGIIGMLGPVMRGLMKTRNSSAAIGMDFDTMVLGHWHQYTPLPRVIVNGSLIGANEYSLGKLRAYPERPQQALWFVHPENGIVSQQAVYCERHPT